MDSLPPELISTIIEHAATCASTEESYRLRLDALSSLALVNRNLHRFAQPLLAQKVIVRSSKGWLSSKNPEFKAAIKSLTHHNLEVLPLSPLVSAYEFAGLRELRLIDWCVHISELGSLPHLARLLLRDSGFYAGEGNSLATLEELSLDRAYVGFPDTPTAFFTTERFPSLRALATYKLVQLNSKAERVEEAVTTKIAESLLAQLDCVITDDLEALVGDGGSSPSSADRVVPPVLFDMKPYARVPPLSSTHIRCRLPYEMPRQRGHVKSSLLFVETLLSESATLEELYLDLLPHECDGYELDGDLEAKISRIEHSGKQAEVKIVWENHRDDWWQSLVSGKFWKRCKAERDEQGKQKRT